MVQIAIILILIMGIFVLIRNSKIIYLKMRKQMAEPQFSRNFLVMRYGSSLYHYENWSIILIRAVVLHYCFFRSRCFID